MKTTKPSRLRQRNPVLRNILVALDFLPCSINVLRHAQAFADAVDARLILIHVVEAFPIDYMLGFEASKVTHEWLIDYSRKRLAQFAATLNGRPTECLVKFGRAYREILQAAADYQADLIVTGSHGYTGLKRVHMGSTAERIVRYATCPVLVVREGRSHRARSKPVKSIRAPKSNLATIGAGH